MVILQVIQRVERGLAPCRRAGMPARFHVEEAYLRILPREIEQLRTFRSVGFRCLERHVRLSGAKPHFTDGHLPVSKFARRRRDGKHESCLRGHRVERNRPSSVIGSPGCLRLLRDRYGDGLSRIGRSLDR